MQLNHILKAVFSTALVRALAAIANVLLILTITRTFSLQEAGSYFFVISLMGALAIISGLGLPKLILKTSSYAGATGEYASLDKLWPYALRNTLLLSVPLALCVVFFAGAIGEAFSKPESVSLLRYLAPVVIGLALIKIAGQFFLGMNRPHSSIGFENLWVPFCAVSFLVIAAHVSALSLSITLYASVYSLIVTIVALCALFYAYRYLAASKRKVTSEVVKPTINRDFYLIDLAVLLSAQGCLVFISKYISSGDFALFSVANSIAAVLSLVITTVNLTFAAKYISHSHTANDELARLVKKITNLLVLAALPVFTVLYFIRNELLIFFGEEYVQASDALLVLLVAQLVNVCAGPVAYLLNQNGYEKDVRNLRVLSGIVGIGLIPFLAFEFGVVGAACCILVTQVIFNLGGFLMVKKRLGFFTVGF